MGRLEETKARLEAVLERFDGAVARMESLRQENQSLQSQLFANQQTAQALRIAAADALGEVDQAIALIAGQASTTGEVVEKNDEFQPVVVPVFEAAAERADPSDHALAVEEPAEAVIEESRISLSVSEVAQEVEEPVAAYDAVEPETDELVEMPEAEPIDELSEPAEPAEQQESDLVAEDTSNANSGASGGSWSILDD